MWNQLLSSFFVCHVSYSLYDSSTAVVCSLSFSFPAPPLLLFSAIRCPVCKHTRVCSDYRIDRTYFYVAFLVVFVRTFLLWPTMIYVSRFVTTCLCILPVACLLHCSLKNQRGHWRTGRAGCPYKRTLRFVGKNTRTPYKTLAWSGHAQVKNSSAHRCSRHIALGRVSSRLLTGTRLTGKIFWPPARVFTHNNRPRLENGAAWVVLQSLSAMSQLYLVNHWAPLSSCLSSASYYTRTKG